MIRIVLKKIDRSIRVDRDAATAVRVKQVKNIINLIHPRQQDIVIKRSQVGPQGPAGPQGPQGIQGVQGPPGTTSVLKTYVEPVESPNSVRTLFTVPDTFIPNSLAVYLNGLQEYNVSEVSTTQFEFDTAPLLDDTIMLVYNN